MSCVTEGRGGSTNSSSSVTSAVWLWDKYLTSLRHSPKTVKAYEREASYGGHVEGSLRPIWLPQAGLIGQLTIRTIGLLRTGLVKSEGPGNESWS